MISEEPTAKPTTPIRLITPEAAAEATSKAVAALESHPDRESVALRAEPELMVVCPDCGKGVAHRGRCPKCGGDSWVPAGDLGGYPQRMRIRQIRQEMQKVSAV